MKKSFCQRERSKEAKKTVVRLEERPLYRKEKRKEDRKLYDRRDSRYTCWKKRQIGEIADIHVGRRRQIGEIADIHVGRRDK